jgi:RNA polymerase sigma-70 factor (ECF subfamily)
MAEKFINEKDLGFDEEKAIRQAQIDAQAFKPLYEKYFKRIFLFILHRVGDKELTADLTQQVFLKALTNLPKFQLRGLPFSAWLFRISLNECNDYYRKTKRARLVTIDEKAANYLFEELTYDYTLEELENRLPDLLGKLKVFELQLIQLRFFEGRSFKEIGEIMDLSEVNAKVKTYRVLDKIRKMFLGK